MWSPKWWLCHKGIVKQSNDRMYAGDFQNIFVGKFRQNV
jgi:hypothetical protein